jgi:hypothetical protein
MPNIIVYAHTSPESMYAAGKKAGLSDEAADYFRYFDEIELELHVDGENGAVTNAIILNKF